MKKLALGAPRHLTLQEQAENIPELERKVFASSSVPTVPSTKKFNIGQAGKREMIHYQKQGNKRWICS